MTNPLLQDLALHSMFWTVSAEAFGMGLFMLLTLPVKIRFSSRIQNQSAYYRVRFWRPKVVCPG